MRRITTRTRCVRPAARRGSRCWRRSALAQLAANVQAQAAAAAARREEGFEQVRSTSARSAPPSLATPARRAPSSRESRRRTIGAGRAAGVAVRVVEQVDEHAAQVLGVEGHAQRLRRQFHRSRLSPSGTPPSAPSRCRRSPTIAVASIATMSRTAPGATSITSSTMRLRRSTLSATMRVSWRCAASVASSASSVGLRDGRQRVADLVRDAGRHAPHRGELLLAAAARLHVAHVLEEQHAESAFVHVPPWARG